MKLLSSNKNPEIKRLRLLIQKSKARKKQGLFVIEGQREIEKALKGNYKLDSLFLKEGSEEEYFEFLQENNQIAQYVVSSSLFKQISIRSGSEKSLAIAYAKTHSISELEITHEALVLVIEAPEKPGNIGALYRTAVAADFDAVIIANPKTDFYNPNSIRSSLGCLFLLPTALASSEAAINYLKQKEVLIAAAAPVPGAQSYDAFEYPTPCALVVGTESTGLDQQWIEAAHQQLIIPMASALDSLNLSVSAGILMYQARGNKINRKKH